MNTVKKSSSERLEAEASKGKSAIWNCPVFVRLRPLTGKDRSTISFEGSNIQVGDREYRYPKSVIADDQQGAYDTGGIDQLLDSFINGHDVNLLANGQTATGKTHTFFGPPGLMERAGRGDFGVEIIDEYGICPRAIMKLIDRIAELNAEQGGQKYLLSASAVELYWYPCDLLFGKCPCFVDRTSKPMELYGQTSIVLSTRNDALQLFSGLSTRNSNSTKLNESSSRSHCFVTLWLATTTGKDSLRESRMQFVDMAGSERLKDAHDTTCKRTDLPAKELEKMMEGMGTNFSLQILSTAVRDVVRFNRKGKMISFNSYICDLVKLLESSLGGTAQTVLYVCVSMDPVNEIHAINALNFGETFGKIKLVDKLTPTKKISIMLNSEKNVISECDAAISRGVKGGYENKRNAQKKRAREKLDIIRFLLDGEI